jgi:ABC-type nitrate/sulfonate/bicarbonate transport system substrate-binding protein
MEGAAMKIKRGAMLAAGLTLLALVMAGSLYRGRAPAVRIPVRFGVQNNAVCALAFIADRMGYFRNQGLDVDIVAYPSGKLAMQAMFDGEVAVAACADLPIAAHSFDRDDFTVFGTIAWTDRGAWIIGRRDRGIAEAQDLRGKRIATQRDSAVHFFLSAYLARHGIREHEIELLFMQPDVLPSELAAGRIDAFCMRNPFVAQANELMGDNAIELFDPNLYRHSFNLVTWRKSMETDRPVWTRFLRAMADAEILLIRDARKARRAVIAQLGDNREGEVLADWDQYTFGLTLDQSLFVTLEEQARWLITQSPEREGGIPNYWRFVDPRPLLAVNPAAVNMIH